MRRSAFVSIVWAASAFAHSNQEIKYPFQPGLSCETALRLLGGMAAPTGLDLVRQSEQRDKAVGAPPERRLKTLTSGRYADTDGTIDPRDQHIDAADPSGPFWLSLPDGRQVVRIYLSGLRYLQADSLDELLSGGIQTVRRIRGFYADGTEMTGLYHEDSFPWDPELHLRPDGVLIGHGGVMAQAVPGQSPKVRAHNQARTRMWAHVKHSRLASGDFEEQWYFQGSLFGPPVLDRWVTAEHQHNYGATFFRNPDGRYLRDCNGHFYMIYERVTEELNGKPWNTEIFVRRVNPEMTRAVGPEHRVQSTRKPNGQPFEASRRGGGHDGFLFEGGRPLKWHDGRKWRWVVAFSGGDYVSTRYGFHIAVSENEDPMSEYKTVVDPSGEAVDFAEYLRCLLNATWGPGRPSLFYDERGQLWGLFHYISKDQIPDDEVKDGWPATPQQFVRRFRRVGLIPITLSSAPNGPQLNLELNHHKNAALIRRMRLCENKTTAMSAAASGF